MKRIAMLGIMVAATLQPAAAGVLDGWVSPGIQGTWSTPEGCAWMNANRDPKKSSQAWPKDFEQFAYLSNGGIEGYEWSCSFVHQDTDAQGNIVATASCTAEGDGWPDLFLVEKGWKSGWRLTNRGHDGRQHTTLFPMRCDNP